MHIQFRYTLGTPEQCEEVKDWVKTRSPGHLLIQHDADKEVSRTHWHGRLTTESTVDASRIAFKRAFPSVGKADFAFAECKDLDAYERYMCHSDVRGGTVNVISCEGINYNLEWFKKQNEEFWDARATFAQAQAKGKGKRGNAVDKLVDRCRAANINRPPDVVDEMFKMFNEEKMLYQEHYMKSVMLTVMMRLNNGETRLYMKGRLLDSVGFKNNFPGSYIANSSSVNLTSTWPEDTSRPLPGPHRLSMQPKILLPDEGSKIVLDE